MIRPSPTASRLLHMVKPASDMDPNQPLLSNSDSARYELLGEIASGGMATVHLGRMRRAHGFSRLVAIKAMHPQFAKDPAFAGMFVDEARLTARLRHPNVVPTLDIICEGDELLIVMEYIEGESLASLLRFSKDAGDSMPVTVACAILHDALLGLHEAHEAKDDDGQGLAIIHRDVSPQNVLVGLDGLARVLDFGVAKARGTVHASFDGEIKGKVPYMPPEQLFGEKLDRTVDIYAAGVLLWESLAGARLFEGPTEEIIVRRISEETVPAPSTRRAELSAVLDAVVLRALSRDNKARFQTALDMANAIAAASPLASRTEVATWVKRHARKRDLSSPSLSSSNSQRTIEVPTTPTDSAIAIEKTQPRPERRFQIATIGAIVALAAAITGVAFARPNVVESTRTVTVASEIKMVSDKTIERIPAPPPAAEDVVPAAETPKPAGSAKATSTPKNTDAESPKPSCRMPYTVDAEGHRHYKVECL